jgi:predicted MFS family arabinose efflux permease
MICIAVVTISSSTTKTSTATSSLCTHLQISFRAINGAALGSILPLSQSLLVEYVPASYRGQAFGLMGAAEKLAGTVSSASVVYLGETHWQYAYYGLGLLSIGMGVLTRFMTFLNVGAGTYAGQHDEEHARKPTGVLSMREIVQRIVRLPAFLCLVAQGVFGGTPWDMMSYLLLLMDWRGFTKDQIVAIQFMQGISSMVGGWLGGVCGDYAAKKNGSQGRILVALVSVIGGIPLYGLFLYSTSFLRALMWITAFNLIATFTPAAAIRPICADLTDGPSERAQIVALWIVLEKTSGAVFGAPLVGYLTERMIETTSQGQQQDNEQKAQVLAYYMFTLSSFFWGACSFFWAMMYGTLKNSGRVHASVSPTELRLGSP